MYALQHPTRRLLQVLAAAPPSVSNDDDDANANSFAHFSPSTVIILVVLLGAFFFMGFFSIYIRRCATRHDVEARIARARAGGGAPSQPTTLTQSQGLDPAVLETLPLVTYSTNSKKRSSNAECVVCLTEFSDGEPLCQLPRCRHVFHKECIDMWLFSHRTCPLCRRSILPDGSRSFRWGGSGSLRLSISGLRGSRRESGHGSTAGPSTPQERQATPGEGRAGLRQVEANSDPEGTGVCKAFPRSHSTGHSLAKQSHSRELLLEVAAHMDQEDIAQPRAGCLPLTPPVVFHRSRSLAAIAAGGGEVPAPVSIRAWMKRALSVKKVKPTAGESDKAESVAAGASSARATFDRLV